MPAHHDASEFVDSEFQSAQQSAYTAPLAPLTTIDPNPPNRPPTREEIEALVSEKQIKLAELKRAQEELERERAGLEELRRRQIEFQTGREEMLQHLTRGIGLLEEAELRARRDAEQTTRTLNEFREAVSKVQSINDQLWIQENLTVELTRALTTIENARMEWNAAQLKFAFLTAAAQAGPQSTAPKLPAPFLGTAELGQLCKIGFALTWPLLVLGLGILLVLLLRH
jgi:hypothetical protein